MRAEFARYHRERRRAVLPARIAAGLAAMLLLGGAGWAIASAQASDAATVAAPANAPAPATAVTDATSATSSVLAGQPTTTPQAGDPAAPDPDAAAAAAAAAAQSSADTTAEPAALPRPQLHTAIAVATRGFQVELDRCQWVRMDVGAVAPIVGAHNYCQGDVILQLADADLVTITGTELDGDYQVTGSRDAHAGDDAAAATAGLTADLLLQTCYRDDSGVRLVTLRRVDLTLAPTPAAG